MKPDGGLVEDVEDAAEVRAKLRGQADALRFPSAEGLCRAVEFQVVEADTTQEVEALSNLWKDVAGDDLLAP